MQVIGTGLTDIGQARDHNEDSFLMDDDLGLYVVCDGIGGHAAGEVASSTATRHIADFLLKHRHTFEQGATEQARLEALALAMTQAIQGACAEIHNMSRSNRDYYGMGTTATALVVMGNHAVMGHVGDSRLYLVRGDAIHRLSQDHTFVQELLRTGVLKPEQAEGHPYSNVLTRSLGKDVSVQVDTLVIDVMDEDLFLLCSDGLTKYFEREREMLQIIREEGVEGAVQTLVDMANARGGGDNITVCLVEPQLDVVDTDTQAYLKSIKQHLKVLREMPLFEGLSMAQMARVLYACNEATYETGDVLIHENAQRHNLGILLEGQVEVTRDDAFLADLVEGDHFGEMSCFFGRPSTATVTAMAPCRCLWISYNKLDRLMETKPALGILLLRNLGQELCQRLEETNHQVVDLQVETMVDIPQAPLTTSASTPSLLGRLLPALAITCFLLSGTTGLLYETLWSRELGLLIGSSSWAHTVTLGTFMAGLGLGNALLGPRADRVRDPLRLYAGLELVLGLWGLASPWLFVALGSLYRAVALGQPVNSPLLLVWKLALGSAALLPPAILMGGTLPALGRWWTRSADQVGQRIGTLYFINTAGAVLGCALGGFLLVEHLGLDHTMRLTASINLGIGVLLLLAAGQLSRPVDSVMTEEGAKEKSGTAHVYSVSQVRAALIGVGVGGALSMLYELVWIRMVGFVFGSSSQSFSVMLMTFIGGIALGGLIASRWLRRDPDALRGLVWCELGVGLSVLAMVPLYERAPYVFAVLRSLLSRSEGAFTVMQVLQVSMLCAVMLVPTTLIGITLPWPAASRSAGWIVWERRSVAPSRAIRWGRWWGFA